MLLFLLLTLSDDAASAPVTPAPFTITNCSDAMTGALREQLTERTAPVAVTCAYRVVVVAVGDSRRVVRRANLSDAELATEIGKAAGELGAAPQVILPDATPSDEGPPRKVELWIEPFGTVSLLFADTVTQLRAFYLKVGATVPVSREWELVISAGVFTTGNGFNSDYDIVRSTAIFASVAPVHFWRIAVAGPRTGFYLGPKVSVAELHRDQEAVYYDRDEVTPAKDSFVAQIGFDAGFRLQVGRTNLTFALPNVSLGYTSGRREDEILPLGGDHFAYDIDFNLIRIGVSL